MSAFDDEVAVFGHTGALERENERLKERVEAQSAYIERLEKFRRMVERFRDQIGDELKEIGA